jgi:hypothetical protein
VRVVFRLLQYSDRSVVQRFLLPRIAQTFHARRSIKTHHLTLMRRLTTSLASLKESQAESHAVLPRPQPYREPVRFSGCHSVAEVLEKLGEKDPVQDIPPVSLIRCGIQDYAKGREGDASKPTTEGLFQYLEGQVPWLVSEEGSKYEVSLNILHTHVYAKPSLDATKAMGNSLHLPAIHRSSFAADTLHKRRKPGANTHALDVYCSDSPGSVTSPSISCRVIVRASPSPKVKFISAYLADPLRFHGIHQYTTISAFPSSTERQWIPWVGKYVRTC